MLDGLPPASFELVMADPPWPWETYSDKGIAKSPTAQYSTMSFGEIEDLQLGRLLVPGGILLLWCTWPLIERQAAVMRAWGCAARSGGAWAKRTRSGKLRWGTGYYGRSLCEPYLLGRKSGGRAALRGRGLANLFETFEDAVVDGLARQHSRKPDEIYRALEDAAPDARRADIFARQVRPGWAGWGRELGKFDGAAA